MNIRIGPVVKLGQFGLETKLVKTVKGCPECKVETNGKFCGECGSKITEFEISKVLDITTSHELLWEVEKCDGGFEDNFYTAEGAKEFVIPNFRVSNVVYIDDSTPTSLTLIPSVEDQNEAIGDVTGHESYKILKEFCDKHNIECDVVYGILNYWN